MNTLWYLLRTFYALGLVPAIPLFAICAMNYSKDPEVAGAVLVACSAYFVLGHLMFSWFPGRFKARLLRHAQRLAPHFNPSFEAFSVLLNRYVGVDRAAGKVLFIDLDSGVEALLDVPEVRSWEVETFKREPSLLKLSTKVPELPLIGFRFNRRESDVLMANLGATFG